LRVPLLTLEIGFYRVIEEKGKNGGAWECWHVNEKEKTEIEDVIKMN
jgi:hypothetical protein